MQSTLRDTEATLPPGFRFHPRDEELISYYLASKVFDTGRNSYESPVMIEVDLNKCEPWDLPEMARVGSKDWYFYSLRDRKYATGLRTNRATLSGYWKATGKDRRVTDIRTGVLVGMRKTLVFYQGRAPRGRKTDWVMHEFRLEGQYSDSSGNSSKEDWVLCKVFCKNKGVPSKSSREENCYDDTGSSSLPPLLDTSPTFDQTPLNLEAFEQVPCFSNLSANQTSQQLNLSFSHFSQAESIIPTKNSSPFGSLPDLGTSLIPNSTSGYVYSCDKTLIKAVLDHFTKLEPTVKMDLSPNLAAGTFVRSLQSPGSSESYLSQTHFPSMWNNY